jgi:hypothetical protein
VLLFLQNICAKHGVQYLASQKLRLRRRLQPHHDLRHRYINRFQNLSKVKLHISTLITVLILRSSSDICDLVKPLLTNIHHKLIVYDGITAWTPPGKNGNASMPEQVKRSNPWRKMMMMILITVFVQVPNFYSVIHILIYIKDRTLKQMKSN